jgi:CubicO group peptidase (beta-lactamase class C family)
MHFRTVSPPPSCWRLAAARAGMTPRRRCRSRAACLRSRATSTALKTFDVPGMAIAIVKDGKVVTAKGYGVRKLGNRPPVDGKTLFEIASNSKASPPPAGDAGRRGQAGLGRSGHQAPAGLPDVRLLRHGPDDGARPAGAPQRPGLGAGDLLWWPSTTFSTDEIIEKLRYIKPATSFRASYAYDNLLYIVAGKIIADKAGKPWGEAMQERILTPLGMTGTRTSVAEMLATSDYAAPHSKINDKIAVVKPMPVPNGGRGRHQHQCRRYRAG